MKTGCLLVVVALLAGNVSGSESPTESPTFSEYWYLRGSPNEWSNPSPDMLKFQKITTDNYVVFTAEIEFNYDQEFKITKDANEYAYEIGDCNNNDGYMTTLDTEGNDYTTRLCGTEGSSRTVVKLPNSGDPFNAGLYFVELMITCGADKVSSPCGEADTNEAGNGIWATFSMKPTKRAPGDVPISCILSCPDTDSPTEAPSLSAPSSSPSEEPTKTTSSPSMSPTTAPSSSPTTTPLISGAHHVGVCMMWATVTTALVIF